MEHIFLLILTCTLLSSAGYFTFQLLRIEEENIFTAMWMGMLPIGIVAFLVNFFFPLHSSVALLCLLPCLLGLAPSFAICKKNLHQSMIRASLALLLLLFCLLHVSLSPQGKAYDTDLYHLQIVAWNMDFPTVAGLGNLHNRLANTSTWLTLAALLPLDVAHMPIFITALFLVATLGWTLSHLITVRQRWEKLFFLCLLPLCCYYIHLPPSLYPDKPSLFLAIIVLHQLLKLFLAHHKHIYTPLALSILFLALGFSIKPLVIIPLLLCMLLFSYYMLYKKSLSVKESVAIFILPIVLGITWCIKNSILSGYPLFPTTLFALPVDWIMTSASVDETRLDVMGWARWPKAGHITALENGFSYWFPHWFSTFINSTTAWATCIMPMLSALLLWTFIFFKGKKRWPLFFIFSYSALSLIYWFYMYPDPRFGAEFAWTLFIAAAALLTTLHMPYLEQCIHFLTKNFKAFSIIGICTIFINLAFIHKEGTVPLSWQAHPWSSTPVKEVIIGKKFPQEAFSIWSPVQGEDRCGKAPLPCGFVHSQLRMRVQGNLSKGFYIKRK